MGRREVTGGEGVFCLIIILGCHTRAASCKHRMVGFGIDFISTCGPTRLGRRCMSVSRHLSLDAREAVEESSLILVDNTSAVRN